MGFLEQIKYDFQNANMDFHEIRSLEVQFKEFIKSELKPHYSTKFLQKLNNIEFFLWNADFNKPDLPEVQKINCYNNAMNQMMELINKLNLNMDEYKKSEYSTIAGDYVVGDKVSGDKAGRDINKADGDITFGNKTTFSAELNKLKNQLNEQIDDKELREELIGIVEDINKNQDDKEKSSQLVNKLWERGAQFMTILGPFAPLLFNL